MHTALDNSDFLKLQATKSYATKIFEFRAGCGSMAGRNPKPKRYVGTAIRLRAIRRSSSHPTPQAFCKFLGIGTSRLSNSENGAPVSRMLQDMIVKKMPWISRSYLMDGDESSMSPAMLQKLAPLIAEESDTTRSRSPRSASAKTTRAGR